MSLDLGPFQDLAGIHFRDQVWAEDIGVMVVTNFGTWNLVECPTTPVSFDAYREYSDNRLTCSLETCEETSYRIRGRSSGIEAEVNLQLKVAAGADCNSGCVVDIGDGVYIGGARGFWSGGQWIQSAFIHSPTLLGFSHGERMDILIRNPWKIAIESIEADPIFSSLPMLNLASAYVSLQTGMRVNVENSNYYDGSWSVYRLPSSTQVTLTGGPSFQGTDTGYLKPHFDYK